jgi:putative hydrolase of the HAD superfamily
MAIGGGCGSGGELWIAVAAWSALLPAIDTDVVALLTQTRDIASVALVSNATTRLEADLEQQGLTGLADVVVNSARVGVAKPDHGIYLIAARRVGVAPDRCLFIDDAAVNVAAARELGMSAVHYRRTKDLRDALAPLITRSQTDRKQAPTGCPPHFQ